MEEPGSRSVNKIQDIWSSLRVPDTKTISCAVDYELYESFQLYCKKHRIKQSQLIRLLISQTVLPKNKWLLVALPSSASLTKESLAPIG